MKYLSILFYAILFYIGLCLFVWNFNTFTLQEKTIILLIISGFQSICGLIDLNSEV